MTGVGGNGDVTLTPVGEQEFAVVRDLAGAIWRQHYEGMIPAGQIEFMLSVRFSDDALRQCGTAADRWLQVMRVSGAPVGYCDCQRVGPPGDERNPTAMKLGQLYLLASHRGRGLGRFMLADVERRARCLQADLLWLLVSKKNEGAIGFYRSAGFVMLQDVTLDIGGGFVMDDYVMGKRVTTA